MWGFRGTDATIGLKEEQCDTCGRMESTHSTPFFCDSDRRGALEAWLHEADRVLEDLEA